MKAYTRYVYKDRIIKKINTEKFQYSDTDTEIPIMIIISLNL